MIKRRTFLAFPLLAAACGRSDERPETEEELGGPYLSESDSTARVFSYVISPSVSLKGKFPTYSPSQNCGNCALFSLKEGGEDGQCSLFPKVLVKRKAWCSAWAPGRRSSE